MIASLSLITYLTSHLVWADREVRSQNIFTCNKPTKRFIVALASCGVRLEKAVDSVLSLSRRLIKVDLFVMTPSLCSNHHTAATNAMHSMNGVQLGSKQIVVRLHEPKQLRQEKLAQRFGHNGHPRNSSGATSPTISEGGESYAGWGSPRHHSAALGSPVGSMYERPDRGRRGSGSYYNVRVSVWFKPRSHLCYRRLLLAPFISRCVMTISLP